MKEKKALIEAALFASENPLTLRKLSKISGITSMRELKEILDKIKQELDVDTRGIELAITSEGYQFRVKNQFLDLTSSLTPYTDLPDGVLRTLGLVALRQPIKQSQIIKIQGNKAYNYIKKLEKRKLINSEKVGRTKILETTSEFERYFGKSLKDIQDGLRMAIENEPNRSSNTPILDKEDETELS